MKHRSPIAVFFLGLIPFYTIYWYVSTEREMRTQGAQIPTAWLLIVPFVNIYWVYKYCQGVDHVTNGKMSAVLSFIMLWLLGSIGQAILQDSFNKLSGLAPAAPYTPPAAPSTPFAPAPAAPIQPTVQPGMPPAPAPMPATPTADQPVYAAPAPTEQPPVQPPTGPINL